MPVSRFKVTFWYPRWRSLKLWKGHLNIPKKVTKNCQVDKPSLIIHLWVKYQKITQPKPSNPRFSVARPATRAETAPASSLRSGAVCFFRHPKTFSRRGKKKCGCSPFVLRGGICMHLSAKITPLKSKMSMGNHHFWIGDTSLNGGFCIVTVVFQDVVCCFLCETDTFTPFSFAMTIVFDNNFFDSRNRFLENRFLFNMYFSNWGIWKKQTKMFMELICTGWVIIPT